MTGVRVEHSVVLVVLIALVGALAYGTPKPSWMIGLDLPTIGWPAYDKDGTLKGVWGLNFALGFSFRNFTAEDGLQPGRFNFYWGWGTVLLFLPTYLEVGALYPFVMDTDKLFCFSVGIMGIFIILPVPYVAASFWL